MRYNHAFFHILEKKIFIIIIIIIVIVCFCSCRKEVFQHKTIIILPPQNVNMLAPVAMKADHIMKTDPTMRV